MSSSSEDELEEDQKAERVDVGTSSDEEFELEEKSETEIRNDLSTLSFEELQALKEKIGLKMYKEAVFGEDRKKSKQNFTRDNKNRPREMSAKRQVPVYREVFQVKKRVQEDPRFNARCGEYNERAFRESYSFVKDIRAKEREELAGMVRQEKDPVKRKTLKGLLLKMKNQEATEKMKDLKARLDDQYSEFLASNRDRKPIYLNKTAKKKIELAERFKELKKAGKLDKYLEKKRKKNVQKERKKLPL
ncbi:ribosomal RNA processing protein 36 homolog [Haemaphysalis longicornis]